MTAWHRGLERNPSLSFNLTRWFAGAVMAVAATSTHATTVRPPDFDQLVGHADAIIQGEVTAIRSEWTGEGERRRIVTRVTVRVAEALVGNVSASESIELLLLGGQVGKERLTVAGMPEFQVGDRDILFVQGNGRQLCPLVAMSYGRYFLADDPNGGTEPIVARSNGVPLASVDEVRLPMTDGTASQLLQKLKRGQGLRASDFANQIASRARALGRKDVPQTRLP